MAASVCLSVTAPLQVPRARVKGNKDTVVLDHWWGLVTRSVGSQDHCISTLSRLSQPCSNAPLLPSHPVHPPVT